MTRRRVDHGPQPIGRSLDAVTGRLGMGASATNARLFAAWGEIVGQAMADHVRPVRMDEASLVVTVDHPAWATQIRHLADDILTRVAAATGRTAPGRIEGPGAGRMIVVTGARMGPTAITPLVHWDIGTGVEEIRSGAASAPHRS